jgi:hypothetical protein
MFSFLQTSVMLLASNNNINNNKKVMFLLGSVFYGKTQVGQIYEKDCPGELPCARI